MDFALSAKAQDYLGRLMVFMAEHVIPADPEYGRQLKRGDMPWNNPRVMEELKAKAKAAGPWNLFLPDPEYGAGLSNLKYAPLAEVTGRSAIAPEVFNCNAPPGAEIERMLTVFGDNDEPSGHGEVSFTDVRVPLANIIAGPGRGFEIAQGRLGPGRIHHCMRLIGAAERAMEYLCERAVPAPPSASLWPIWAAMRTWWPTAALP